MGFLLDGKKKTKKSSDARSDKEALVNDHDPVFRPELDLEAVNLTIPEMSEVCQIHYMAFTNLTSTPWHQRSTEAVEEELRYVDPVVSGYQMAAHLGKRYWLLIGQ